MSNKDWWDKMVAESEANKNNPNIWVQKFGRKIRTAEDAYQFLAEHPYAYDRNDEGEWNKLSLRERWLESTRQFLNNLDIVFYMGRVYLETGPIYYGHEFPEETGWRRNMHDPRLDVDAKTFEKALIKLAKRVRRYYGDY